MKIGLIADTHLPSAGPELSAEIAQALEGVDLILHCGGHIHRVVPGLAGAHCASESGPGHL